MKKRCYIKRLLLSTMALSITNQTHALGECGLACCIAGASTSGVTLAPNFGVSLQYEDMFMETIRNGTNKITPDEVIAQKWQKGSSYNVPTKMVMRKLSLTAAYPINERLQILSMIPYVQNDMDMRMKDKTGMIMNTKMSTINSLGDISVMGLYTAYTDAPIRPTERLTVGFGLKTPTGKNDYKTSTGSYVHAMMQAGSGSWDGLLMANYLRAFYPFVFQANAFVHLSTKGDEGYQFGNQFSYDFISRYQISDYVNVGLDVNGVYSTKDKDHDGKYTRATTSMIDNPDNTGLHSILLSPSVQFKIPNSVGSVELKFQTPIYQKVNGLQQVIDKRIFLSTTWSF